MISGRTRSSATGTLTNTVSVNSDTFDLNSANNSATASTIVNAKSDINVTIKDNPDPVIAGENLTYNLTVSNQGPSDALNVALTGNTALGNMEYSLDNGNTWSGSLNIGTIVTGSSKQVSIRGKVPSSTLGSFTSTWNVNSNTEDLNLANNAFTEVTTVNTLADLSIKIADSQDPALNGGKLNYAVLISNNGPSNAQNVKLTGNIPLQDIIYSLNKGITWNLWTGSLNLGNITSGNSTLILFSGKVSHSASSTLNCTLSVNSDIIDPDTGNNIASELTVVSTRAEFNQDLKDDYKGNGKSNCGPKALIIALSKLGAVANAEYIALVAGTNNTGTSFYGLVQAVKNLGLNLTGLKLDAEQLKPFDIVLLNFNGTGHYSVILSITNDKVVLSDPTFGIITISKADFLKLYTGYALTFNPDGRGTPLTNDQMKNLTGKMAEIVLGSSTTAAAGFSWLPPVAIAIILFGVTFYVGNYVLDNYFPNLIPNKGTGWKGLGIDLFNTLSPFIKLNPDGTLPDWLTSLLRKYDPHSDPKLKKDLENHRKFLDEGGIKGILGKIPTPKDIRDQIEKFVNNLSNLSTSYKVIGTLITLLLPGYFVFKNIPPSVRDVLIGGIINKAKSTFKPIVKATKTVFKAFKNEYKEYKKQGAVKYLKHKVQQAKRAYKTYIKPIVQRYVKPIVHRVLKPITKTVAYKVIRNLPGIKQGINVLKWGAKKLGFW